MNCFVKLRFETISFVLFVVQHQDVTDVTSLFISFVLWCQVYVWVFVYLNELIVCSQVFVLGMTMSVQTAASVTTTQGVAEDEDVDDFGPQLVKKLSVKSPFITP